MRCYPNCKINLGLHVVRRRADGFHDLETLFLPIPLCDTLEIEPAAEFAFVQDGLPMVDDGKENLVVRAFRLMQREFPSRVLPVSIHLTKHIPCGAGLGGGSSNVAFTLLMLNELYDLKLEQKQLTRLAAQLGADCPFFILNEPVYATGIGDCMTPLGFNPLKGLQLLLVKPDEAVSTAEAYGNIVPRERWASTPAMLLPDAVRTPVAQWRETVCNDFERSVFEQHPRLRQLKQRLYDSGALYASMTGSGSAFFGLYNGQPPAERFDDCMHFSFSF